MFRRGVYRVGQLGQALSPVVPHRDVRLAAALLAPPQLAVFQRLPATDRRHAARVLRRLLAEGARDPDLLVAALLHDLGKIDLARRGRVRIAHRVARVVLQPRWPAVWHWLGARPRRGALFGCYLLRHHAMLGADWAARLGCTPRACALIAAHETGDVPSDLATALAWLRRVDDWS